MSTWHSSVENKVSVCRSGLETRTMRGNQVAEGDVLELV